MGILIPGMPEALVVAGRSLIGTPYEYEAETRHAPGLVNCQTFVWLICKQHSIAFPDLLSEQLQLGVFIPDFRDIKTGDLILSLGAGRYVFRDRGRAKKGIGHIGLATGAGTILHASSRAGAVVEESLPAFLNGNPARFRGAVRLFER